MFGNYEIADMIAYQCMKIDNICRQELRNGIIPNERDYVSSLSVRIRDFFRREYSCHAQTLRQGIEMANGVDGIIMFQFESEIKVGWYEAKWPRVNQLDYHWDSVHRVREISHFTEQLFKQHQWEDTLVLWEMFFNEAEDGFESPPYECFGSSCVWHKNAFNFILSEGIVFERWTTEILKRLLDTNCINFYDVIYNMLSCKKGKKIKIVRGQKSIQVENPKNPENIIEIPLPTNTEVLERDDNAINSFMRERNIAGYLLIDLTSQKKK